MMCVCRQPCELPLMMCALRLKGYNLPCPSSRASVCSDNTQDKQDVCDCVHLCVWLHSEPLKILQRLSPCTYSSVCVLAGCVPAPLSLEPDSGRWIMDNAGIKSAHL